MPLSEHEQHLLEQMEQALYAEDPKFASHMQGATARARLRRRLVLGMLAVFAGLVLVVVGVMNAAIWLGGLGFGLLVAGAAYAFTPSKTPQPTLAAVEQDGTVRAPSKASGARKASRSHARPPSRPSGTFMQRLEQRWDRRRHDWQ